MTAFDRIEALAFDHYGTLFDKQAVAAVFASRRRRAAFLSSMAMVPEVAGWGRRAG